MKQKEWLNGSGYYDPTAYQALKKLNYLPIVYICSSFSGDEVVNAELARQYAHFALEKGTIPITPNLLFPHIMNDLDVEGRQHALRVKLILLGRCKELWVFGDNLSEGMRQEIQRAKHRNMMIRWFSEDCQEVTR
ncbi:DUF7768 domain-containing protein [Fundicoccus ignavus]|uniref:DUF4406 domain-containing protein n=1 Tax=Fundicoccus ignavus TaxID=2664442 RepID=A0A844BYJ9_9LACT|nr:DUF4406 domain-containing protein [Fundicoccus ignavus]MRJ47099.1 DUF4406 domain-containing protein [Fundicoccus ignavus]